MNLASLAMNVLGGGPTFLIPFVTSRCNARCPFCFYGDRVGSPDPPEELSTDEWEMISRRCGRIPYLLISGGEPVMRDDLAGIVGGFIRNAGTRFVTVPSNGLLPERSEALFERLTREHPGVHFRAAFSLDFPDSRHDAARRRPGCLESLTRAARSVGALRGGRRNLTLDMVSVYMPENASDHVELARMVEELFQPDNHELRILRPPWPERFSRELDPAAFLETLEFYRRMSRRRESRRLSFVFRGLNNVSMDVLPNLISGGFEAPCTAGTKLVVISETGEVRLCELRSEVLGSLRESGYDLSRVLQSPGARETVARMRHDRCACTWECALAMSLLKSPRHLPAIVRESLREILGPKGG